MGLVRETGKPFAQVARDLRTNDGTLGNWVNAIEPTALSCRALGVSRSWFCKWNGGVLPPRAARRQRLEAEVVRLFTLRKGAYGTPQITADLKDAGWRVSNTVAALMREQPAGRRMLRGAHHARGFADRPVFGAVWPGIGQRVTPSHPARQVHCGRHRHLRRAGPGGFLWGVL